MCARKKNISYPKATQLCLSLILLVAQSEQGGVARSMEKGKVLLGLVERWGEWPITLGTYNPACPRFSRVEPPGVKRLGPL